jgi:hypothetical protein
VTSKIYSSTYCRNALPKVKAAAQAWNTRDPEIVAHAYPEDPNGAIGPASSAAKTRARLSQKEVGKGIGIPFDHGTLVLHRESEIGSFRI